MRALALAFALVLAGYGAAQAAGPYPLQSASSVSNDFQTQPQTISAACATANYVNCVANSTAGVNLVATSVATITLFGGSNQTGQIELSWDGNHFFTIPVYPIGSTTSQATITGDGSFTTPTYGATVIQYRATSYTSGNETVIYHLTTASVSTSNNSGSVAVNNFPAGFNVTNFPGNQTVTVSGNTVVTQPTGTNLHTVCDSGCGAAPPYTYTINGGTTAVVIKTGSGTLAGVQNLATAAQTSGMTCIWYDNTAASGNVLYEAGPFGSGQVVTFAGGQGIKFLTGLTEQCSGGTPVAPGISTLWI